MKNPFAQYPRVFYQLVWLFIICIVNLIIGLLDLVFHADALFNIFQTFDPTAYTLLIISALYILFGYIIDKMQAIRKSIQRGAFFILLGFLISSILGFIGPIGSSVAGWGFIIGSLLVIIGSGIISLACMIHIGILFPIANDWKDNAFSILYFSLILFGITFGIVAVLTIEALSIIELIQNPFFLIFTKLIGIGYLYYLINKYQDIGYEIQDDETELSDEDTEEKKEFNLSHTMIGLVVISTLFSFFTNQIPKIGQASFFTNSRIDEFFGLMTYGYSIVSFFVLFSFFVLGYILVRKAKYHSRQFLKIYIISLILILMAALEFVVPSFGSLSIDIILETSQSFLYILIITPIFLSIATHVNLGKNIGVWMGLLVGLPTVFNEFLTMSLGPDSDDYLPYVAFVLLLIFLITFRENRKNWEERLALNEPNQVNEEEDGMDIIEHFVEE